jgi:hypothetical protein
VKFWNTTTLDFIVTLVRVRLTTYRSFQKGSRSLRNGFHFVVDSQRRHQQSIAVLENRWRRSQVIIRGALKKPNYDRKSHAGTNVEVHEGQKASPQERTTLNEIPPCRKYPARRSCHTSRQEEPDEFVASLKDLLYRSNKHWNDSEDEGAIWITGWGLGCAAAKLGTFCFLLHP